MRRLMGAVFTVVALSACGNGSDDATVVTRTPSDDPVTVEVRDRPAVEIEPSEPTSRNDLPVDAEPVAAQRSITVGGMGAEYAEPDRCTIDLGVNARRPTVDEATRAVSAAGEALVTALTDAGVEPSAIQTSGFWIHPMMDHYEYTVITGYDVSMDYRVTLPDVGDVGSVLASAVRAGGDSVRATSLRFEADHIALMDAARADAWADVQARAESTAEHAGEPLGDVLDVHEKVLVTTSHGMMQGGEGDSASFDIPVSPGVSGVTVLLTVTYEIGT